MADETPEERKARWRSVAIGGKRADTRKPTDPNYVRPVVQPTWEGTPVKDHRGVPYLNTRTGAPVTAKQFANNRGHFEKQIRAIKNAPRPPER